MRKIDLAQLYLRIAVGGMLILHNIWKYQNYNDVISGYPALDGFSGRLWFTLFSFVECVTALMLILGWRVRLAALMLVVGSVVAMTIYFPAPTFSDLELKGVYTFVYIYILIVGGGVYSFDAARTSGDVEIRTE